MEFPDIKDFSPESIDYKTKDLDYRLFMENCKKRGQG
jgi:hypothetical protein